MLLFLKVCEAIKSLQFMKRNYLIILLCLIQISVFSQLNPPYYNNIWPGRPLPTDSMPIKGMSKFIHDSIQSPAFEGKGIGYCVVLPKDYYNPTFSKTTFPVIYFLHGSTGMETSDIYNTRFYYDKMLVDSFPQTILVYPNGMDGYNGKIETHIINELIPFINKKFRTSLNCRGITGFSMGASGALQFYLKYPKLFSHVVCFDGRSIAKKKSIEIESTENHNSKKDQNDESFFSLFEKTCEKYPGIEKKMKIMILQGAMRNGQKNQFVDYLISKNVKPIFLPADLPHDATAFYRVFNSVIMSFEAENLCNVKK